MADSGEEWDRYRRWNTAIADVIYPLSEAGIPVYLDLEDDVLAAIAAIAEPNVSEPHEALVEVVKATLTFGRGRSQVLRQHLINLDAWWCDADTVEAPPTLALAAVFSLAAENMHDGEGKSANNYYDRLAQLLKISPDDLGALKEAYRVRYDEMAVSKYLWTSLNDWLEYLEGNRGLPTAIASATGHAHIGFPLSQALVRATDRERFIEMFAAYGLPPGGSLPPSEMAQLLADWMSMVPCPATNNLERMWSTEAAARERIVDVARLCLESWDGTGADDIAAPSSAGRHDLVRVRAQLRSFPRPEIEVTLILPARVEQEVETLEVLDKDESVIGELDLVGAASGWMTLADPSEVNPGSLLGGLVSFRREGRPLPLARRPRRLIPMRKDVLMQAYVEVERVQLGEDSLLLARSEIAPAVTKLLENAARPGFNQIEVLPGLPPGWVLFKNVQILSSIPDSEFRNKLVDLNVLQPLAVSYCAFQGGMRLPGHLQKWSTAAPPELRVSTDSASQIRALLEPRGVFAGSKPEFREYGIEEPVLIWDLENEDLPDGDYLVSIFLDGTTRAESTHTLRLRSADTPALLLPQDEVPLRHAPQDLLFGLSAGRSDVAADSFRCAPVEDGQLSAIPPPEGVPAWYSERKSGPRFERRAEVLAFPDPGGASCMTTGAHLMQIETGGAGMASVEGVCGYCGLVKRYPTRGRKKGQGRGRAKTKLAPTVNVQELAAVRHGVGPDWTVGFDAVCHVGQGKLAALHRVAQQIEPGSLFSNLFVRRLEMLGHVEIQRDAMSLQPVVWEVVDPTLAGLPSGELLLLGFRNQKSLAVLEDFASRAGATVRTDLDPDGPPVIRIADLRVEKIDDLLGVISEATHRPAKWIPNAAQSLARHLPTMSRLIAALPEVSALGARTFERWDPASARFVDASDASTPGAYRLTGNTRAYVYRAADQVGTMTATLGNARLVKYAAAADSGRRLAGYDRESRVLYVPLGADLPGLFGRAAVLASGFPPLDNPEEGILEYRRVPENIAGQIMNQLSS